jgi:hypothetical protein
MNLALLISLSVSTLMNYYLFWKGLLWIIYLFIVGNVPLTYGFYTYPTLLTIIPSNFLQLYNTPMVQF